MVIKRGFEGGLNLDAASYLVPRGDYVDARNITKDARAGGSDGVINAIVGNQVVFNQFWEAGDICIGAEKDVYRNRVICFYYHPSGRHKILEYRNATRTFAKIIISKTDSGGVDILHFTLSEKILDIDIYHRNEGDLIFWNQPSIGPRALDIFKMQTGAYGTLIEQYIEAAKRPPLQPPAVNYMDDSDRTTNTLRRKLYQFASRWSYDNFSKSSYSPISKVPIPAGLLGTDKDLDATKNNCISVDLQAGEKNVSGIEVIARELVDGNWSDFFLVSSLNKAELGIADNSTFQYKFYNDGSYPAIDIKENPIVHPFDWFPRLAGSQSMANGNTLLYAAITEGYDRMNSTLLDIQMTVAHIQNSGVDAGAPALNYTQPGSNIFSFTVSGPVPVGTQYRVQAFIGGGVGQIPLTSYTSIPGDTINTVASALFFATPAIYQGTPPAGPVYTNFLPNGSFIVYIAVTPGSTAGSITTATSWPWYDRRRFALAYFDVQGRIIGGALTFVDLASTLTDFEIETGAFQLTSGVPMTPVISAEINHAPPAGAVKFAWLRSESLAFERYLYYGTSDFIQDADYLYFGLENISYYKSANDRFIYPAVESYVADGDRVRIVADFNNAGYTGVIRNEDYEILGVVEKQMTGGSSTEVGKYIKVKKPVGAISPAYTANMLVIVYTPAKNATAQDQVYFEFGEHYDIVGGFHKGSIQDQTISQPATFEFRTGDAYYKQRTTYYDIIGSPGKAELMIMDPNYSDYFKSAVSDNGRPQAADPNAKEQFYPEVIRFSEEYISNTNINRTNRFYFENFIEVTRSYGDIMRMRSRDKEIRVWQKFKCGSIPVFQQIVQTADGTDVLSQSDRLLNNIQYKVGEFGIGDCRESLASNNFADYFVDNNRGVILRWSLDGLTPISVLYKVNSWATRELPLRGVASKVYGVFDAEFNRYIMSLEASGDSPATTLSFYEPQNVFEGFHDMPAEMMCCLGTLLITFHNGDLWTHDSTTYAQFYDTSYEPSVTAVFNDGEDISKAFLAMSQIGNKAWKCPEISTSIGQASSLLTGDFRKKQDSYVTDLKRDSNTNVVTKGDRLKGTWLKAKFTGPNDGTVSSLVVAKIKFIISNLNTK